MKFLFFLTQIRMDFITKKTCTRNNIEVIVDYPRISWLNKKHIEKFLDNKNLPVFLRSYHSDYTKHKYKLVDKPEKQRNTTFLHKDSALKLKVNCGTAE